MGDVDVMDIIVLLPGFTLSIAVVEIGAKQRAVSYNTQ